MRCPFCNEEASQVKDSRTTDGAAAVRRRRLCTSCGGRFTTFERIELRSLMVSKRGGDQVPFDREKLARSVLIALRKRPIPRERAERMISSIVRQLENQGNGEISTRDIGETVLSALAEIDSVAYVRFASVYRNFEAASDFESFIAAIRPSRDPSDS